jgi:hypothetical protein
LLSLSRCRLLSIPDTIMFGANGTLVAVPHHTTRDRRGKE